MAVNHLETKTQSREDEYRTIEHHLIQIPTLKGLVIDKKATEELKGYAQTLFYILGPKHVLGNEHLPADPKGAKTIRLLQENWKTGEDSVPAIIFVARGSVGFKVDWAMVRPGEFTLTPEELLLSIQRADEINAPDRVRSLGFVYTIVKGERPPGSNDLSPLGSLSGRSRF